MGDDQPRWGLGPSRHRRNARCCAPICCRPVGILCSVLVSILTSSQHGACTVEPVFQLVQGLHTQTCLFLFACILKPENLMSRLISRWNCSPVDVLLQPEWLARQLEDMRTWEPIDNRISSQIPTVSWRAPLSVAAALFAPTRGGHVEFGLAV